MATVPLNPCALSAPSIVRHVCFHLKAMLALLSDSSDREANLSSFFSMEDCLITYLKSHSFYHSDKYDKNYQMTIFPHSNTNNILLPAGGSATSDGSTSTSTSVLHSTCCGSPAELRAVLRRAPRCPPLTPEAELALYYFMKCEQVGAPLQTSPVPPCYSVYRTTSTLCSPYA